MSSKDSVGMWLDAAARHPIVGYDEQLILGAAIQRMQADGSTARQKRIGQRALTRLVQGNLRLVVPIARKYSRGIQGAGCSLEFEDLLQAGAIGLHAAATKFDPTRGYKFSTMAYWWITQAIQKDLIKYRGAYKIPTILQDLNRRWLQRPAGQTVEAFIAAWPQHRYTVEKLAEAQLAVSALASIVSLDARLPGADSDGGTALELFDDGRDEGAELLRQLDLDLVMAHAKEEASDALALVELAELDGVSVVALGPLIGETRHGAGVQLAAAKARLRVVLAGGRELVAA